MKSECRILLFSMILIGGGGLGGCEAIGVIAAKTIPQTEKPGYIGLQNQTVGVMVWADRGTRIDFDRIELDTANSIQAALKASKAKELQGATFPVQPASIVRYRLDRPYLETMPVTEFAGELGVTRLIYVELERFTTRSDFNYQMFRGTAVATLKVIEIDPTDRTARVAYEENGITAGFPEKGRVEGEIAGNDTAFYAGTIRALTTQLVNRLTTHEVDQ